MAELHTRLKCADFDRKRHTDDVDSDRTSQSKKGKAMGKEAGDEGSSAVESTTDAALLVRTGPTSQLATADRNALSATKASWLDTVTSAPGPRKDRLALRGSSWRSQQ